MLGRRHDVEIQAAATDDGFLLSLPGTIRLAAREVFDLLSPEALEATLTEAVLEVPMFAIRWRWAASRALLVPRMRAGRRVPPHIQRTDADELLLSALPGSRAGQALRVEGKMGGARSRVLAAAPAPVLPDQPLLRQTLADCLQEAMDLNGLAALLRDIAAGEVATAAAERTTPSPAAFAFVTARPPAFLDNGALMDRRARNVTAGPRHLAIEAEVAVLPEAVARVRAELRPDLRSAEDLATHLSLAGLVAGDELPEARAWLEDLAGSGRALAFRAANGRDLWGATEQLPQLAAAFPTLRPRCPAPADLPPEAALARLLRGWLETRGPVTRDDIVRALGVPDAVADAAMRRLEAEGAVLHGAHDPDRPGAETWCDRRVLARIERLTRNRLRAEIEPVSLQDLYRFLLRWQGLSPGHRRMGLAEALAALDGVELPAAAWEAAVLPARVARYDMDELDELCLGGRFGWGRLSPPPAREGRAALTRATPIAIFATENIETWRALAATEDAAGLSGAAAKLDAALGARGASFLPAIERALRLPRFELEAGLAELVAAGRLTADSFAGLRVLLAKPARRQVSRLDMLGQANSGRWALLPPAAPPADPVAREAAVEAQARALLRRYGVVTRVVVQREGLAMGWLDLLRVLRRLEARGEVRGGYFVEGAGGEHFALPEALPLLRAVRAAAPSGELVCLSAADPLNLTGVLTGTPRIAAKPTATILLRDAVPVAIEDGRRATALDGQAAPGPAELAALRARPVVPGLAAYR